jgi:hypothetical protein
MCGAEAVYGNMEACIEEAIKDAANDAGNKEKRAGGSY